MTEVVIHIPAWPLLLIAVLLIISNSLDIYKIRLERKLESLRKENDRKS